MKKICFLLCCITFTIAVLGQSHTVIISGQVKEGKECLESVLITLYDSSGKARHTSITDKEGKYIITVPVANYHLIAAMPGYLAEERILLLTERKKSVQPIKLKRNPPQFAH